MNTVYVGVGTNIERDKHAQAAWDELALLGEQLRSSPVYECEPVGFDSHAFYNFIIELKTDCSLTEFSLLLRQIELKWGRLENAHKYQDRNLDLDIVLFGDVISQSSPELPRSDIFKYPFVTQPLYDLCPEKIIPSDGRSVAQIYQQMDNLDSLQAVSLCFNKDVR